MRILHTFAGRNLGGVDLRILDQVQWLLEHGYFGMVAAPRDSMLTKLCGKRNLPLAEIDFDRPLDLRAIWALRRVLHRRRITIVDTHSHRDSLTAMFCRDLCAVVRTRHASQVLKPSSRRQWPWRNGCDHIIATAAAVAFSLEERPDFGTAGVEFTASAEALIASGVRPDDGFARGILAEPRE